MASTLHRFGGPIAVTWITDPAQVAGEAEEREVATGRAVPGAHPAGARARYVGKLTSFRSLRAALLFSIN